MRTISFWAKNHRRESQALVILSWICLNVIGIFIGKLLFEINIVIPVTYLFLFSCSIILLCLYYPENKRQKQTVTYSRRKMFDFSLAVVTLLMIIYTGNHWKYLSLDTQQVYAAGTHRNFSDTSFRNHYLIKDFAAKLNAARRENLTLKEKLKIVKTQLRAVKKMKGISKVGKIALIALSVFVALLLLAGIASLSCSLSCSGSEGLAALVGIGGLFLVIFFTVLVIKKITRKKTDTT